MAVVVVAAVMIRGARVLLTRRPGGGHLAGYWEFPGGKLEDGESPEEALRRELFEETGLFCEVGGVLDVVFWRYPDKDVLVLFYRVRGGGGEPRHIGVADHVWATLDALDGYELPPADLRVKRKVKDILSGLAA